MSIEKNLERIADALEKLASGERQQRPTRTRPVKAEAPKAETPKAETPKAEPAEPAEPKAVSRDAVREALRQFVKTHDRDTAKAKLEELGASSVSALDEDKLADALAAFSE